MSPGAAPEPDQDRRAGRRLGARRHLVLFALRGPSVRRRDTARGDVGNLHRPPLDLRAMRPDVPEALCRAVDAPWRSVPSIASRASRRWCRLCCRLPRDAGGSRPIACSRWANRRRARAVPTLAASRAVATMTTADGLSSTLSTTEHDGKRATTETSPPRDPSPNAPARRLRIAALALVIAMGAVLTASVRSADWERVSAPATASATPVAASAVQPTPMASSTAIAPAVSGVVAQAASASASAAGSLRRSASSHRLALQRGPLHLP